MNLIEILLLSIGLAMDAFAVSIASGCVVRRPRFAQAAVMAFFFGAFQMLMPCLGWAVGRELRDFIAGIDHWIAFGLLLFIGLRMVWEGIQPEADSKANPFAWRTLFFLSVATSIDALAAGVSFAFLNLSILFPVVVIGAVTFFFSFAGVWAGARFGHVLESKARTAGGLILIGIGTKILIEHLSGA